MKNQKIKTKLYILFSSVFLMSCSCENSAQDNSTSFTNKTVINKEEAIKLADDELKLYLVKLNQYFNSNKLEFSYFDKAVKESKENNKPILNIKYRLKKEVKKMYDEYTYQNYRFEIKVYYNTDEEIKKLNKFRKISGESDFEIKITNYYFGREKNITIIDRNSILCKIDLLGNHDFLTLDKIALNKDETDKLSKLMKTFPFDKLQKSYVDNNVEDGTQIQFNIKFGETEKDIFISNVWQEDLGNLVSIITGFLEEDYIYYYKDLFEY